MRRATCALSAVLAIWAIVLPPGAGAQERLSANATLLFYGDNTEFRNPFREGHTLLGVAARLFIGIDMSERIRVNLGAFGNRRFGGDHSFELVRPFASLVFRGAQSKVVLGALEFVDDGRPIGPDHHGPHDLLPPLQRETLTFERPFEEGLQWTLASPRWRHEAWLNWQRVNTPTHRERFDAGVVARLEVSPRVALGVQGHVVHSGGQLFASGPVNDSVAYGLGILTRLPHGAFHRLVLDVYGLISHDVPDRAEPARRTDGLGLFARLSAERAGWRGHVLFWRGCDFLKAEGDPNYLSILRSGTRYRQTRDYSEAGVTRRIALVEGAWFEAAARVHRVEGHYDYSYRLIARIELAGLIP